MLKQKPVIFFGVYDVTNNDLVHIVPSYNVQKVYEWLKVSKEKYHVSPMNWHTLRYFTDCDIPKDAKPFDTAHGEMLWSRKDGTLSLILNEVSGEKENA